MSGASAASLLEIDLVAQDQAGIGIVDNSTLAGPVGIQLGQGGVRVNNATILGDGAASDGGVGASIFTSSIVASCSTPELDPEGNDPGPGFVDDGNNVGGCFSDGSVIDTQLADNGCVIATPVGCAPTVALRPGSPALEAGICGPTDGGSGEIDQRGAPRSPIGPGCDAGSFEDVPGFPLCLNAGGEFFVTTADELNAAIGCYNLAEAGAGEHRIYVQSDIEADSISGSSVFAEIIQRNDVQLVIYGEGFTVRRGPGAGSSPAALLRLSGSSLASFATFDLNLEVGPAERSAISSDGPRVSIFRSSITAGAGGTTAIGIVGTGGEVTADIVESLIDGMTIGIQLDGELLDVRQSTIASTQVDLDLTLSIENFSGMDDSTLGGPVGVQITRGQFSVANSTVIGDGGVQVGGGPVGDGQIVIFYGSSVVGSCTLPLATGVYPAGIAAPATPTLAAAS